MYPRTEAELGVVSEFLESVLRTIQRVVIFSHWPCNSMRDSCRLCVYLAPPPCILVSSSSSSSSSSLYPSLSALDHANLQFKMKVEF